MRSHGKTRSLKPWERQTAEIRALERRFHAFPPALTPEYVLRLPAEGWPG